MVLNYYGFAASYAQIGDSIVKDEDGASFLTEIGRFARNRGLAVDCFSYNLYLTDPTDARLSQPSLLRRLLGEQTDVTDQWFKEELDSIIQCMRDGVRYVIAKPSLDEMVKRIHLGFPVIVTTNPCALYDRQGNPFESHDIVLTGSEGDAFLFIDPQDATERTISSSGLMFAILQRKIIVASSYMLAISPPVSTPSSKTRLSQAHTSAKCYLARNTVQDMAGK
jgi:hypothetical protein